jgi:hypothetical protein
VYAEILPAQQADFWSALQNLSTAHREGKHLLVASPEITTFIDRGGKLMDARALAILRKCARDFTQNIALLRDPSIPEHLVLGSTPVRRGTAIEIPWHYFADSGFAQSTALLAENASDIQFYEIAAEAWLFQRRIRFRVSLQYIPGGGSTTYQVADMWHRGRRSLCLCILDSDRCSPHDALGGTAAKVQSTLPSPPEPFFRLHILADCREAENLISAASYRKIYPQSPANFGMIEQHRDLWSFADLKNGTTGHSVLQSNNAHTVAYWTSFTGVASCPAGSCTKQCCACTLGASVPGDIAQTMSLLKIASTEKRCEDLSPWPSQLENVAALVAAWTLAPKPTLT